MSFADFNPLPRKEGDLAAAGLAYGAKISIHSLVKRETVFLQEIIPRTNHFNPLPRKEGDTAFYSFSVATSDFNPLPRKEGDSLTTRAT